MQLDLAALDDEQFDFATRSDHLNEFVRIMQSPEFERISASQRVDSVEHITNERPYDTRDHAPAIVIVQALVEFTNLTVRTLNNVLRPYEVLSGQW
jgi:hypothetical protein